MVELNTKQNGFTLIELVIVIVLIGILAATALPRFADLTGDARLAVAQGVAGNFAAAASIAHAQWIADGGTSSVDSVTLEGSTTVYVTDEGWPETVGTAPTTSGTTTASGCVGLWNGILHNPPSVATSSGSDFTATVGTGTCIFTDADSNVITYNVTTGDVSIS